MRVVVKLLPDGERDKAVIEMLKHARGLDDDYSSLQEEFPNDFEMAIQVLKSAQTILAAGHFATQTGQIRRIRR